MTNRLLQWKQIIIDDFHPQCLRQKFGKSLPKWTTLDVIFGFGLKKNLFGSGKTPSFSLI